MIGKVIIGKSFRGCIAYCLEDKKLSTGKAIINHRADVLQYNLCFGNKKELTEQFKDVRKLKPGLSKPVLHITLSLATGEKLDRHILQQVVKDCAKHIGFDKNQYLAVEHKDTPHPHLHIIANRVGFDGRTLSDSNSYKRIAEFCRQAEIKYGLMQVLSPRRFLTKKLRHFPRNDSRKEALRSDIINALFKARNYVQFEAMLKAEGYKVEKGRGIAFTDKKRVRIKGSEVGYSLSRIERILAQKAQTMNSKQFNRKANDHIFNENSLPLNSKSLQEQNPLKEMFQNTLQPEFQNYFISSQLLTKKKKKKRNRSLGL